MLFFVVPLSLPPEMLRVTLHVCSSFVSLTSQGLSGAGMNEKSPRGAPDDLGEHLRAVVETNRYDIEFWIDPPVSRPTLPSWKAVAPLVGKLKASLEFAESPP